MIDLGLCPRKVSDGFAMTPFSRSPITSNIARLERGRLFRKRKGRTENDSFSDGGLLHAGFNWNGRVGAAVPRQYGRGPRPPNKLATCTRSLFPSSDRHRGRFSHRRNRAIDLRADRMVVLTGRGVMAGSVATVEVADPYEITPTMWELFTPTPTSAITPPQFLARSYRAGDWRRYKTEKHSYRTTVSVGKLGRTCFVRMADREATDMVIGSPGLDHFCLTFLQQGRGLLCQPRAASPAETNAGGGVIFHGRPGTVLKTGTEAVKTNVWIPAGLLRNQATLMLDGSDAHELNFDAGIDVTSAAGAGLRRLTEWLYAELSHPDSPLSNEIVAAPAQELFLRTIVLAATHSRTMQLRGQARAAAPATVRRAEEFMRSKAESPLTLEEIAQAAGCGSRALQAAFHAFRGTSPMASLRRIRLDLAHQAILRSDGSISVTEVAARYGFSNPGRFASQYHRLFGEYPSRIASLRPLRR